LLGKRLAAVLEHRDEPNRQTWEISMPQADAENTTPTPVTRQAVEAQIDLLIDLLDQLEPDPDLEPSFGFSTGGHYPENLPQEGDAFHCYWDAGHDHEDEHTGEEPDVDGETSLGWTSQINQASPHWQANHLGTVDLEEGAGPVRKPRPKSKTGGKVLRGCAVLL
jgi:hypothetical protein